MPERAVLAHPSHPGRERLGDDQLGEQLAGVLLDLFDRRVLVATVEVAQEVGAVGAVELEQAGRLDHRAQRVADPLGRVEPARRQPRVALDDVRGDQRVLEVEGHDLAPGVEHLLAHAGHAIGAGRRSWRGLHPGVLDDRRQVDLGDVGRPVDAARVDVEVGPVGGVEAVPDLHQVVDLVDRLALGVEPVELDVGQRPLDLEALHLDLRRPLGLASAQRHVVQHLLAAGEHRLGAVELALDLATTDELPLGGHDRLALGVVHRMLAEPAAGVVDERAVLQRVDAAGRDLRDRWGLVGPEGGDGDDRGDHEVDRDDVDGALRGAGERAEQAAGVGDDHGLGHAEAADPARLRLGERRLDDRRPHDRDRHVALHVGERLLAERLGERVGVGPADAGGTGAAGLDELVLDPALAELFGLRRERRARRPRRARPGRRRGT